MVVLGIIIVLQVVGVILAFVYQEEVSSELISLLLKDRFYFIVVVGSGIHPQRLGPPAD